MRLKYIFIFAVLVSCLGCKARKRPPNLRETYLYDDKNPFGGNIAYRALNAFYPEQFINIKSGSFAETSGLANDSASVYVLICPRLKFDESDESALMNFVYQGNRVFISSAEIDSQLLEELHVKQKDFNADAFSGLPVFMPTSATLIPDAGLVKDSFAYFYLPVVNYFYASHALNSRVVGYNSFGAPNLLVYSWGKGKLYLHCEPRLLSNYFLLKEDNYLYWSQLLQTFPASPQHVYWDDHYARLGNSSGDNGDFSTLAMIFKNPPLKIAFWISLLLLGLYIFFQGKRRQRIVPVIKPVANSSVAFAEAIAGLYLDKKDNKSIADKMIMYFNEFVRARYFLNTASINAEFIDALSRKSGVDAGLTADLYQRIAEAASSPKITDEALQKLNAQINQFYKTKA